MNQCFKKIISKKCYNRKILKIRDNIDKNYVWISVDET